MSDIDKETRKAVFPKWRCVRCNRIIIHNPFPKIPAIQIDTSTARMISTSVGRRWFWGRVVILLEDLSISMTIWRCKPEGKQQFKVLCRFTIVQNATWTKSNIYVCVCECCAWFLTRGCVIGIWSNIAKLMKNIIFSTISNTKNIPTLHLWTFAGCWKFWRWILLSGEVLHTNVTIKSCQVLSYTLLTYTVPDTLWI